MSLYEVIIRRIVGALFEDHVETVNKVIHSEFDPRRVRIDCAGPASGRTGCAGVTRGCSGSSLSFLCGTECGGDCLCSGDLAAIRGPLLGLELEIKENTLDGCTGCGCRSKGALEQGKERKWWMSFIRSPPPAKSNPQPAN